LANLKLQASPKIIKYALLVFVIVQLIGLAVFITVSFTYWEEEIDQDLGGLMSSRLVASEESLGSVNGSGSGGSEEVIIPVLESPLTSTTMTPDAEIIYVKVPVRVPHDSYSRSKLSHNQLVGVVFRILLVVLNALWSSIYSIIMTFYLVTL